MVPEYVVVGHINKAHGTKGELFVWPLTDRLDQVFVEGARVHLGDSEGNRLRIPATVLEIESVREGDRVLVRICDTGAGIDPEDLARICDPFFTTKDPDEGEGIGLFVVQQIVKKYDGTIRFESKVGEGTTCTITFPFQEPAKEAP